MKNDLYLYKISVNFQWIIDANQFWSIIFNHRPHHPDTLWWTYKKQLKMAIEIVDFPIKHGDFPLLC